MLLEGIETLLILSKEKTMSRTGSLLYISQSAVSKRIANLEKRLGKKLVVPDGRHIRLTADAQALIDRVGPSFHELSGLIFEQQTLEDNTLIRFDCSETLVAGLLSEVMGKYFSHDKRITITTNHTPRIVEHVRSGKATLGLCAGYLPGNHGLTTFHLYDEPVFIVSQQPLAQLPQQIITNDLSNSANTYQASILEHLGITPIMEMDSYTAAAQLALQGVAPALVPLSIIQTLSVSPHNYFSFDALQPLFRPIHLCLRAMTYRSPRIKSLIAAIVDAVPTTVSEPLIKTSE
ncbi:LysR family transcriptional regulator [Vibrio mangrovi]|uniref:DNA-binding transcriptional regulator IlvY n=1 Tax=Vibrio mangrovi TaxID=474394 RepID=A0A1Y6IRJ8_9VIBR|nr:LysR family transcriptional regulator [Vibrio mangrovi]MDW6001725.1 LysR family transcriptional regulator [Vibrio mangrovi]SMS00248.1 DNA-binding transcriptional regulator IlvY [Vibrio mangrovi]